MTQKNPVPRPGILDIHPYVGGEGRSPSSGQPPARLASNENALGCSPQARAAYLAAGDDLNRYPDGSCAALRAAIGKTYGLDPEKIVCGNGSEELIALLVRAYAGAGDEVLYSQHGFLMYPLAAKAVGAVPVAAPEKDMRTEVGALLAAVTPKTKMVLLANPNNPTGSYLTSAEMKRIREGLRSDILLAVDAAYAEFVDEADYDDSRALVDAAQNTVMLRTFSKIHGLAALRLGWGYFPSDVAGVIHRIRGAFNVSAPAQAAGVAALADADFIARTKAMVKEGRAQLSEGLAALGLKVWPSVGNFLLADFGAKAEEIRLALRDRGVFIRQMGVYGLPTCLRVTVGTAKDNERLLDALRDLR
jgi:histidinol-phosphate aminotransferase